MTSNREHDLEYDFGMNEANKELEKVEKKMKKKLRSCKTSGCKEGVIDAMRNYWSINSVFNPNRK